MIFNTKPPRSSPTKGMSRRPPGASRSSHKDAGCVPPANTTMASTWPGSNVAASPWTSSTCCRPLRFARAFAAHRLSNSSAYASLAWRRLRCAIWAEPLAQCEGHQRVAADDRPLNGLLYPIIERLALIDRVHRAKDEVSPPADLDGAMP